jgi:hypothetical protein
MTMLFTHQSSAIHAFDHNACNRGNTFQASSPIKSVPLQYHVPASVENRPPLVEKSSNKPSLHESLEAQAVLVMPYPKKAAVLCPNAFFGGNPVSPVTTVSPRWGLSSVLEDTQEDEVLTTATAQVDTADDHFFEQAACAELMEIMSSNGSSRSSSQSSSPQLNENNESSVPMQSTVPFGLFEEYATVFGTSPIVRANNPLPNDQSFSPTHPDPAASEVAQHFQSFLARHHHQAKVFNFNLNVDEAGEMQAPYSSKLNCVGVSF